MSFMLRIEAAQRSPLDQLAVDFYNRERAQKAEHPSLDFCRRLAGVPDKDGVIAERLDVAVASIRSWREVGRRATQGPWSAL